MKEVYEELEIEVISFSSEDVICTSPQGCGGDSCANETAEVEV